MSERSLPAWRDLLRTWGPVVLVAALNQLSVGATNPWSGGSGPGRALGTLVLALPLAWLATAPLFVAVAVAVAAVAQVPLGDSLSFGAFLAVLVAAYGVARHEDSRARMAVGLGVLVVGATVAGSLEQGGLDANAVIPVIYIGAALLLGRLVRHLASQAQRLREVNAALELQRDQEARLAVAGERLRIARELHDVVAHRIMLMVIQAEAGVETVDSDPGPTRASLLRIQEAGRQGLEDLRGLVRVLRSDVEDVQPPGLSDLGALAAVLREARLDVELVRAGGLDDVPAAVQEAAFRIVQEALTNVLKHSEAGVARVSVRAGGGTATDTAGALVVEVSDPGPAVRERSSAVASAGGQGLTGMAERVAAHGGTLDVDDTGGGFRVRATFPVLERRRTDVATTTGHGATGVVA